MHEKLKRVSLRVLLLLRILLTIVPVITLLSWLFPENNLSQSNVKMTLSRFRTKLKEFLEERGQYI